MSMVEERVDSLESLIGQFVVQVNTALLRLEKEMKEFKDEMKVFKNEMAVFKDEMKEFKNEMLVFKDEMKEFKDEMKGFKDGTLTWREEIDKERKAMNKQWGELARKMGTVTEDLIAPALRPVLSKYFCCDVQMEGQRMRKRLAGREYEVDAIALGDDKVFMIETRSTPKSEYVDEVLDKSKVFFEFFPEYKDKKLILLFGSIIFPENVLQYASKRKLYAMAYKEWEYMDILNFDLINNTLKSNN